MAATLPGRIGLVALAMALALLMVGWWFSRLASGDRQADLQPPPPTARAPELAKSAEPIQLPAAEPGPVATAPAKEVAAAQSADARARAAFMVNVHTGNLRELLGEGMPVDVLRLIASGKVREGVQTLMQMGRDGDITGYYAVVRLLSACPGPGEDRDAQRRADDLKAANDRIIETARLSGASEDVAKRLRWALDAGNAQYRQIWAEFCPGPDQGDAAALLAEARVAVPVPQANTREAAERLRDATQAERKRAFEEARPAAEAFHKQLAEAGLLRAQVNVARQNLHSADEAVRAEAFRNLLELASTSAQAKFELAMCIRRACVPEAGGNVEARELLIDAARLGHFEALRNLTRPTPFGRRGDLELSPVESYAWSSVYDALQADGCFGLTRYGIWARGSQQSFSAVLMTMSPSEAREAERRARDLLAAELPTIRANMSCED